VITLANTNPFPVIMMYCECIIPSHSPLQFFAELGKNTELSNDFFYSCRDFLADTVTVYIVAAHIERLKASANMFI
jgi:hypothetical protein